MIIYGLKTCDTCRKARKALPAATFVDVREEGLPGEVLDRALALFGDKLVNTRMIMHNPLAVCGSGWTPPR